MRKKIMLLVLAAVLAGCSTNLKIVRDYDADGNLERETVTEYSDTGLALATQEKANAEYYGQEEALDIEFSYDHNGRMEGIKRLTYSPNKVQSNVRIPATVSEITGDAVGNLLNPANWLQALTGWAVVEAVKKDNTHTNVNAAGDATYSAPEQHDTVHTSADPAGADRSMPETTEIIDSYNRKHER